MNSPAHYFHWGFVLISTANLVIIGLMILVFVAAILVPFPRRGSESGSDAAVQGDTAPRGGTQ